MDRVLRVTDGPLVGALYVLGDRTRIGRAPDVHIQLTELAVSRQHARIVRLSDGAYELTDLSSKTGTFVDGGEVVQHRLELGQSVTIGGSTFVFEENRTPAVTSTTFGEKVRGFKALRATQDVPTQRGGARAAVQRRPDSAPYAAAYAPRPATAASSAGVAAAGPTPVSRKRASTMRQMPAMGAAPVWSPAMERTRDEGSGARLLANILRKSDDAAAPAEGAANADGSKDASGPAIPLGPVHGSASHDAEAANVPSKPASFSPVAFSTEETGPQPAAVQPDVPVAAELRITRPEPVSPVTSTPPEPAPVPQARPVRAAALVQPEPAAPVASPEAVTRPEPSAHRRSAPVSRPPAVDAFAGLEPGSREYALAVLRDVLDYRRLRLTELRGDVLADADRSRFDDLQARLLGGAEGDDLPATRRFTRFECRLPATVTQRDGSFSRTLDVELLDLSAGGTRLSLHDPAIRPGDEVWLAFNLAALFSCGQRVVFRSRVVWTLADRGSMGLMFGGNAVFAPSVEDALAGL